MGPENRSGCSGTCNANKDEMDKSWKTSREIDKRDPRIRRRRKESDLGRGLRRIHKETGQGGKDAQDENEEAGESKPRRRKKGTQATHGGGEG